MKSLKEITENWRNNPKIVAICTTNIQHRVEIVQTTNIQIQMCIKEG